MQNINNIVKELKNRKVFRSLAIYAAFAFVLIQVCSIVFPALHLPDWTTTFAVVLVIIGFPTTLIFSWIYDVTPDGIQKTDKEKSSGSKNNSTIILILVIVSGLLFYFQNNFFKPKMNPKSIAVLPFDNYSPKLEDEFLSDGFTEVIIANLAKVKDLIVISRTSVMRYKDTDMSLKEIAKELNVANILEGSIQKKGNKIRVVGQLIEAKTDDHLWSETYDMDIDDIFSIQTSIAKEIAASLKLTITESEKAIIEDKLTDNIEAYEYYLKIRELRNSKTFYDKNNELRLALLEKIIKLDPNFAEAIALLSIEHSEMVHFGLDKSQRRIDLAKENIEKAYRLKPESPDVQFAYGYYYYGCYKDFLRALEYYEYALTQEPGNAEYISYIGYAHRRLGNWDEMLQYLEKALVLNPNDISLRGNLRASYEFLRQYDKLNYTDYDAKWYKVMPDDPNLYSRRATWTFRLEGKTDNARKIIDKASKWIPDHDYYYYPLHFFDRYDHKYDSVLKYINNKEDSLKFYQNWISSKFLALSEIYWLMGEKDQSKKEAQKALDQLLELPNIDKDSRYHKMLGWIYAYLDDAQKAIQESKIAMELYPPKKDQFEADEYEINLAIIYAITGEHKIALDMLGKLMSEPSNINWWDLKYSDIYNKIFDNNPRLNKMIKEDEEKFRREITIDISNYLPN